MAVNFDEILKLSVEERLKLVATIWDSIADDAGGMPLSDAEKALLDERIRDMEENPDDSVPWSEVRDRLRKRL